MTLIPDGHAKRIKGSALATIYTFFGVAAVVVLVKLWVYPEWKVRDAHPLELPAELRVGDWELIQWDKLVIAPEEQPRPRATRQYEYASNGVLVRVEARSYEELRVELGDHVVGTMNLEESGEVQSLGELGWALVREQDGATMLDVCLDAQGRATATSEQFAAYRSWRDGTGRKILQWLFGRGPVHDRRCLWVHMSLSGDAMNPDESYERLVSLLRNWRSAWLSQLESN